MYESVKYKIWNSIERCQEKHQYEITQEFTQKCHQQCLAEMDME